MKDANYNRKRQLKAVSFLKEDHAEILEYANSLDDFSGTVRELLQKEMGNEQNNSNDMYCDACSRCGIHQN